jgi:D-3-phosphoglycerate dehydrogenase / 2-oxoglutarate reductase
LLLKLLTKAVMMATARHVPEACSSIKAGKWERSKFVGSELKGKTLAIVGLGKGEKSHIEMRKGNILISHSWFDRR